MELDLGSKPEAKVTIGADVYMVSVPTVRQSIKFSKDMDSCKDDFKKTEMFFKFISDLGLPEKVVNDLALSQMSMLVDGLIGDAEKK